MAAQQGKRRLVIWGGLLVLLAGSIGLLMIARDRQAARQPEDVAPPVEEEDAAPRIEVRIVDEVGKPVSEARAWVSQAGSRWNPAAATLSFPRREGGTDVWIQCRGYRSLELQGVEESQDAVLPRALVVRIIVGGRPVLPGLPYRLYFQLRPADGAWTHFTKTQLDGLVSLMDSMRAPPPDVTPSTRESFGYEVSRDQAEAGVLLPLPGPYDVRWGLFDVDRQLWYSRKDGTVTTIEVKDQRLPQLLEIPIDTEEVDATKAELDEFQVAEDESR